MIDLAAEDMDGPVYLKPGVPGTFTARIVDKETCGPLPGCNGYLVNITLDGVRQNSRLGQPLYDEVPWYLESFSLTVAALGEHTVCISVWIDGDLNRTNDEACRSLVVSSGVSKKRVALISEGTELDPLSAHLDDMNVPFDILNDNGEFTYTEDLTRLLDYSVVVLGGNRETTDAEQEVLEGFAELGGGLLLVGSSLLDSNTSWADLVRSSTFGVSQDSVDAPFDVVDDTHPAMTGPYGTFPAGTQVTPASISHSFVQADTSQGARTVARLFYTPVNDPARADMVTSFTPPGSGGDITYWNGDGLDWVDPPGREMFKNYVDPRLWGASAIDLALQNVTITGFSLPGFTNNGKLTVLNRGSAATGATLFTVALLDANLTEIPGTNNTFNTVPALNPYEFSLGLPFQWTAPSTNDTTVYVRVWLPVLAGEAVLDNNVYTKEVYVDDEPRRGRLGLFADQTELSGIEPYLQDWGVPYDTWYNDRTRRWTEDPGLLFQYQAVIYSSSIRVISDLQNESLFAYSRYGGRFLFTGTSIIDMFGQGGKSNFLMQGILGVTVPDDLVFGDTLVVEDPDHPFNKGICGIFEKDFRIGPLLPIQNGAVVNTSTGTRVVSYLAGDTYVKVTSFWPGNGGSADYWNALGQEEWLQDADARGMLCNWIDWAMSNPQEDIDVGLYNFYGPKRLVPGTTGTFGAYAWNRGRLDIPGPITVRFTVNGAPVSSQPIPGPLPVGQSAVSEVTWTAPADGMYTLCFEADVLPGETATANNRRCGDVDVYTPRAYLLLDDIHCNAFYHDIWAKDLRFMRYWLNFTSIEYGLPLNYTQRCSWPFEYSSVELTSAVLSRYAALIVINPLLPFKPNEEAAVRAAQNAGMGLLVLTSAPESMENLTTHAGIFWNGPNALGTPTWTRQIASHPSTVNVQSLYPGYPQFSLTVRAPAAALVRDETFATIQAAVSKAGRGRVAALPDVHWFSNSDIELNDSKLFSRQLIEWLATPTPAENYDLAVVDLQVAENYRSGVPTTVDLTVENLGALAVAGATVNLYEDTVAVANTTVSLFSGQAQQLTLPWTPPGTTGWRTLTGEIVPVLGETTVENNRFDEQTFVVNPVAYVLAHEGKNQTREWNLLLDDVVKAGYWVNHTTANLTPALLAGYNVLVASNPMLPYDAAEASAAQSFVQAGGGLLAAGPYYGDYVNPLISYSGIAFDTSGQDVAAWKPGMTTAILPHWTTFGIRALWYAGGLAAVGALDVTGSATTLALDNTPPGTPGQKITIQAAAATYGTGRIVTVANWDFFRDPYLDLFHNREFGARVMTWLMQRDPAADAGLDPLSAPRFSRMDPVTLTSRVWNLGKATATIGVDLLVDGAVTDTQTFANVAPGELKDVIFVWTPPEERTFTVAFRTNLTGDADASNDLAAANLTAFKPRGMVLLDRGHSNPPDIDRLANLLMENHIWVDELTGAFDVPVMNRYDVVVSVGASGPFGNSETTQMQTYVSTGGRLLLRAEDAAYAEFTSDGGIRWDGPQPSWKGTTGTLNPHPATEGVGELAYGGGAISLRVDSPAQPLAYDAVGTAIVAAAALVGDGKIAALAGTSWVSDDVLEDEDQARFAVQLVRWLIAPASFRDLAAADFGVPRYTEPSATYGLAARVFSAGTTSTLRLDVSKGWWDTESVISPSVLALPDGTYRMYYAGNDGTRSRILSARSSDMLTWEREALVIDADYALDAGGAEDPEVVVLANGSYMMFYSGLTTIPQWWILAAWSSDGLNFTKLGWVLRPTNIPVDPDGLHVRAPSVVPLGPNLWRMYYAGLDMGVQGRWRVLSAYSLDLLNWTSEAGVRIDPGSGAFSGGSDKNGALHPGALGLPNGTVRVYYAGDDNTGLKVVSAWSGNGINFTRDQPLVRIPQGGTYETGGTSAPFPILLNGTDGTVRVFYAGTKWNEKTRILSAICVEYLNCTRETPPPVENVTVEFLVDGALGLTWRTNVSLRKDVGFAWNWTTAVTGYHNLTFRVVPDLPDHYLGNDEIVRQTYTRKALGRVLWEEKHTSDFITTVSRADPFWMYTVLSDALEKRGIDVVANQLDLSWNSPGKARLSQYDAFIIPQPRRSYTQAELDLIRSYVQDRGGFGVLGDDDLGILNDLTAFAEISWEYGGAPGNTTDFGYHVITDGLTQVYAQAPMARLDQQLTQNPYYWATVLRDNRGDSILEVRENPTPSSNGRVAAIVDENMLSDAAVTYADNLEFAVRTVEWLIGALANLPGMPIIKHFPINETIIGVPIPVETVIQDSPGPREGIVNATLNYTDVNNASYEVPIDLANNTNYDWFIPSQNVTGNVTYWIRAYDWDGNMARSPVFTNTVHTVRILPDTLPPNITHAPPPQVYVNQTISLPVVRVTDNIGVNASSVLMNYTNVTGVPTADVAPTAISGDNYYFQIPLQDSLGWINYSFRASDVNGNTAQTGNFTVQVIEDKVPPSKPTGLTIDPYPNGGRLLLSWNPNPTSDGPIKNYTVYKSLDNENFTRIATVPGWRVTDGKIRHENFGVQDCLGATCISYYYYVEAWDEAGNPSEPSTVKVGTPRDFEAPPPPDSVYATASLDGTVVTVGWAYDPGTRIPDNDLEAWNVYVSPDSPTAGYYRVNRDPVPAKPDGGGEARRAWYTEIVGLSLGHSYYFKIEGVDEVPNPSNLTSLPAVVTVVDAERPDKPLMHPPVVDPRGTAVNLSWERSVAPDVSVYQVEYYSATQGWRTLTTVPALLNTARADSLTNNVDYLFRVRAVDKSNNPSEWSNEVTARPRDSIPPGRIQGVTATSVPAGEALTVRWAAPPETDLQWVYLEASVNNATWALLDVLQPYLTSFLHTGLTDNVPYYYRLRAEDRSQNVGANSTVAVGVPTDTVPPAIPLGLSATGTLQSGEVLLEWVPNVDADLAGYLVEFSVGNAIYAPLANASAASSAFLATNLSDEVLYCFRVSAFDEVPLLSAPSAPDCAVPHAIPSPPSRPTVAPVPEGGALAVAWNASPSPNVIGYLLLRSENSVNYTLVAELPANVTSFMDRGLVDGRRYYYEVQSFAEITVFFDFLGGNITFVQRSLPSAPASGVPRDTVPPGAVAGLGVTPAGGAAQLVWLPAGDEDVVAYRVYRSFFPDSLGVRIAEVSGTAYTDPTVARGTRYYYVVTAADDAGNEGPAEGQQSFLLPPTGPGDGDEPGTGPGSGGFFGSPVFDWLLWLVLAILLVVAFYLVYGARGKEGEAVANGAEATAPPETPTPATEEPAPRVCGNCGAGNPLEETVCLSCGTILGVPIPAEPPRPEAVPAGVPATVPPAADQGIPCANCGTLVLVGEAVCSNCGTVLTTDARLCAHCGRPMSYVEVYDLWYCFSCGRYAERPKGAPHPKCGTPLSYLGKYDRWFCFTCKEYA